MTNRPTAVRHWILAATTAAAFLMYLDRICMAAIMNSDSFKADIPLDAQSDGWIKGAFFAAYALGQLPAGYLAVRFGARSLMSVYIVLWSAFTVLTGFATGAISLLLARVGCGLAEAGAYPISSGLLAKWSEWSKRGFTSSVVSMGGRIGGAVAPWLTVTVIAGFGDWRWAGWIYGAAGIFFALFFWRVFRERPREHPSVNEAELALLEAGRPPESAASAPKTYVFPWRLALTHRSLWMNSGAQFFTNLGWAFLAVSLSKYLIEVKGVEKKLAETINTLALSIGILGLIVGGYLTDACLKKWGVRLGRVIPLAGSRFLAAIFFVIAMGLDNPWALMAAFGLAAFSTDSGLPALWAGLQEMCGKHTPPLFGWANMWGNLGAAIGIWVLPVLIKNWDANGDWREGLIFCACAFVLSGLFCLGFNPGKRMPQET
ncbi:MAG: MFS transporter [Verrucomicrobia bacterium]|nr:MFS transporter [Verrucomicrobiota bacterium]